MTTSHEMSPRTTGQLRIAGWTTAAILVAAPAVAMRLGVEGVVWTASDFVLAGVIFAIVGGVCEAAARVSANLAYRAATVAAVACGFLQVWINLAVGIIGSEDNPANWTYFAVVLVAAGGAVVALGKARLLARAMFVAAGAQAIFSVLHALGGTPTPVIDGFFSLLWIVAGRLFARAARQQSGG